LGRRDEKIAKLNDSLTQANKELQTVRDEKSQLEITLEDIQKKQMEKEENMHTGKSQNIIEKIAKW
jgi:predicted  nucleic acid-binding Zn-ribbon protein